MRKKILIAAYDAATLCLAALLLSLGLVEPAHAYIDPSVMTYTVQAVAGVAVALSAVAGVAFRRGRKRFMRLLDIDEDAKRQYEGEIHRVLPDGRVEPDGARQASEFEGQVHNASEMVSILEGIESLQDKEPDWAEEMYSPDEDEIQEGIRAIEALAEEAPRPGDSDYPECDSDGGSDAGAAEGEPEEGRRKWADQRPYKPSLNTRLLYAFLVSSFFVFTVFVVAPLEIVAGSTSSLVYGPGEIWPVIVLPGVGLLGLLMLLLALLRGRAFSIGITFVCALALCGYAQALLLNFGLPAADGATIYWIDYLPQQIISSVVWIAVIAGAIVYSVHNRLRMQGIVAILSVALVIVQGVGLGAFLWQQSPHPIQDETFAEVGDLPADYADKLPDSKGVVTEDGLFSVSSSDNVIVFILDTFDYGYLKRVLKNDPHALDEFTGFTDYQNCTGTMIPTRFAMPVLLTGEMPSFDEPFSTYVAERYKRGTFMDQINAAGYSLGVYTDSMTISSLPLEEQIRIAGLTANVHDLPQSAIDYPQALAALYQMALYRDVPWPLKFIFWYYTDQINAAFVEYHDDDAPEETVYIIDDLRYYQRLRSLGLSVEDGTAGAVRLIHLQGSHYPFYYDEDAQDVGDGNSNVFKQTRGALEIVGEYLRQLKGLGLYDQATIIVTADHGYWTITEDPIEETSNPVMFVKPSQTAQEAERPIVIDTKPVSQLDIQATILDAMGLDYSSYALREGYEGYSMFDDIDPSRVRRYLTTDSLPDLQETQFREYQIVGDALDFGNWSETGRHIDAIEWPD